MIFYNGSIKAVMKEPGAIVIFVYVCISVCDNTAFRRMYKVQKEFLLTEYDSVCNN